MVYKEQILNEISDIETQIALIEKGNSTYKKVDLEMSGTTIYCKKDLTSNVIDGPGKMIKKDKDSLEEHISIGNFKKAV